LFVGRGENKWFLLKLDKMQKRPQSF
jgi:hypothetical protein